MLESYIHNTSTNPNTDLIPQIWLTKTMLTRTKPVSFDHRGHHFDAMAMSAAMWGNRS